MLTRPLPDSLKGPLGSHKGYITHIALANYVQYLKFKQAVAEQERSGTSIQYEEFRLFLNAVESLNNIPEYLYWEHAKQPTENKGRIYLGSLRDKFPVLRDLADLANAYKHCDRSEKNKRSARDLQRVHIEISILVSQPHLSRSVFNFSGPLLEDHARGDAAFKFWLDYHQSTYTNPTTDELINV